MNVLFFDLETTGLNTSSDRIVEIAVVVFNEVGEILSKYSAIINPNMQMSSEVIRVHGISNEEAAKGKVWRDEASYVKELIESADFICGHNISSFDIPMLCSNMDRVGISLSIDNKKIIDTLSFSQRYLPHLKNKKLSDLAAFTGVRLDNAHRALPDTIANGQAFFACLGRLDMTFDSLLSQPTIGKFNMLDDHGPVHTLIQGLYRINSYK